MHCNTVGVVRIFDSFLHHCIDVFISLNILIFGFCDYLIFGFTEYLPKDVLVSCFPGFGCVISQEQHLIFCAINEAMMKQKKTRIDHAEFNLHVAMSQQSKHISLKNDPERPSEVG